MSFEVSGTVHTAALIAVKAPVCGTCRYAKRLDVAKIQCEGVPPTPVMVGVNTNLAGQQEPMIALMRPQLPASTAGCALHAEETFASSLVKGEA